MNWLYVIGDNAAYVYTQIIWLFVRLWACITVKDPCKNCLIKSCCTEKCEEKIQILNFIYPEEKEGDAKFIGVVCLIALVVPSFLLIYFTIMTIADL